MLIKDPVRSIVSINNVNPGPSKEYSKRVSRKRRSKSLDTRDQGSEESSSDEGGQCNR